MGIWTGSAENEICICGHSESAHRPFTGCRNKHCSCNAFLNETRVVWLRSVAAAELVQAESAARELADFRDAVRLKRSARIVRALIFTK